MATLKVICINDNSMPKDFVNKDLWIKLLHEYYVTDFRFITKTNCLGISLGGIDLSNDEKYRYFRVDRFAFRSIKKFIKVFLYRNPTNSDIVNKQNLILIELFKNLGWRKIMINKDKYFVIEKIIDTEKFLEYTKKLADLTETRKLMDDAMKAMNGNPQLEEQRKDAKEFFEKAKFKTDEKPNDDNLQG